MVSGPERSNVAAGRSPALRSGLCEAQQVGHSDDLEIAFETRSNGRVPATSGW